MSVPSAVSDAPVEEKPKIEGLTKRAVAGTAWSAMATAAKQVLTLASLATVARRLGPGAYGVMAMAAIVIGFINNFRDLGTAIAIIQKPAVSKRLLSSLFWVNAGLGAAMCLVVLVAAPGTAQFFHTPELAAVLRVLSLSFLLASLGVVHNALLTRDMAFRKLAVIDVSAGILTYLVALMCAYSGLGVWSLVFANVVNSLASSIGYWAAYAFRPAFLFDTAEIRSIARFSSNLSGFGLVNYGCRNADNLIVGRFLGTAPLGFYQMAYNLMLTPLQNITSVIAQVLFPAFSRIQEDTDRFRHAYVRGCMLIGLLTFPVMAGLGVVAQPLIEALLGAKWIPTVIIFQILAPVGLVQSVQGTVGVIYQAKGRTDWMFRMSLVTLAATVTAFLVGVRWGAAGVAAGYAIVYFGVLVYPSLAVPFRLIDLRLKDFVVALLPQMLWTGAMALVCMGWLASFQHFGFTNAWFLLLSTSAIGVVVYVGGLLLTQPPVVRHLDAVLHTSEHRLLVRVASLLRLRRERVVI